MSLSGLPITTAELVRHRSSVLKDSRHKQRLLALLAARFVDPERCGISDDAAERHSTLIRNVAATAFMQPAASIIAIIERGMLTPWGAQLAGKRYPDEASRRNFVLEWFQRDETDETSARFGQEIIRAYFASQPLLAEEVERYAGLAPYFDEHAPMEQKRRPAKPEQFGVTTQDELWLKELSHKRLTDEELSQLIATLNTVFATEQTMKEQWQAFFSALGWFNPDHPLHSAFIACCGPTCERPVSPRQVVELARQASKARRVSVAAVFEAALQLTHWPQSEPSIRVPQPRRTATSTTIGRKEQAAKPARSVVRFPAKPKPEDSPEPWLRTPAEEVAHIKKCLGLNARGSRSEAVIPDERLGFYQNIVDSLDRDHTLLDVTSAPGIAELSGKELAALAREAADMADAEQEPTLRWLNLRISQIKKNKEND